MSAPQTSPLMTDKQVAAYFGISVRTLRRRLAAKEVKPGVIDFKAADPKMPLENGHRVWLRERVERLLRA